MSRSTQDALLRQLKEPFDPNFIKWRVGQVSKDKTKATALAYLDAREVYKRLDDVCGIGGWQSTIKEIAGGFICELSILIDGVWVTKSDAADFTDIESIKGGASSALKRAAAVWGVGRYLYYLPNKWVEIDQWKKLKHIPSLPDWATPSHNIERWEDVLEMELSKQKELEDDTKSADDKKAELLKNLEKN